MSGRASLKLVKYAYVRGQSNPYPTNEIIRIRYRQKKQRAQWVKSGSICHSNGGGISRYVVMMEENLFFSRIEQSNSANSASNHPNNFCELFVFLQVVDVDYTL